MTAPDEQPVDGRFGMPTEGMTRSILDAGLGAIGVALYTALTLFADGRTREADPSVASLAHESGLSARSVRRLIQQGARLGLWTTTVRRYSSGDARTTLVVLHDHHLAHRRPRLRLVAPGRGRNAGAS